MKTVFCLLIGFLPLVTNSQSWQEVAVPTDNNLKDVFFLNEDFGWIVGDNGTVLQYNSDGWIPIESEFSINSFNSLFFTDSIHGWIIGDKGAILYYSSGMISAVESPTEEDLSDIFMIDTTCGWIVGEDGTILELINNEWISYPTESFSANLRNLNNIQFLDSTNGIITGDYNRILIYVDSSWNEVEDQTNMQDYKGLYILDKENIFWYHSDNYGGAGTTPSGCFEINNLLLNKGDCIGVFGSKQNAEISIIDKYASWAVMGYYIYKFDGDSFDRFSLGDESKQES